VKKIIPQKSAARTAG